MRVPPFHQFIDPLLRLLANCPTGIAAGEAADALADQIGLDETDRALLLPSQKQPVYRNRIGWAHDRLKRRGWSSSPRHGVWKLTDDGRAFLTSHPAPLDEDEIHMLAYPPPGSRISPPAETPGESAALPPPATSSPEELIEEGLEELQDRVARDLLERIHRASPRFFETLVLDLLHAMGYGTSRADLEHVGGSGDGGIDGIISLDRLGLEKVFIQAKRWSDRVGRPAVQGFYGALAGRRASKGVFITTSYFSADATEFARQVEKIVLVDGARLTQLMIEHGVGVSHRVLKLPRIDSDYFEEE
jgi:restriction system protein